MTSSEHNRTNPPRLERDKEEDLVRRLYDQQMERASKREEERRRELKKMSTSPRRIKKDEEENLVTRIYDQQMQRFRQSREERERQVYEETHRNDKKLSETDIQEQIDRVYTQEIAKSKARREELNKRYQQVGEVKTISKAELKKSVERLYHVDYAKRDEELFKKHVYPYDPPTTRISPSEVDAMANRLSTRANV